MVIGLDGNEANLDRRVGVHQYAFEILWGFYRLNINKSEKDTFIIYLKDQPRKDLPKENANWKYKILAGKRLWLVTKLTPKLIFSKKLDVFFTPIHYSPLLLRVPLVCTIHDLGYLKFSEQFRKFDFWQLKYWSAISIIISKYIIAVSQSTKEDIVRQYPFASEKVKVVYHGYDKEKFNLKISQKFVRQVKEKYKIYSEYLLFLGTLKPSKNIEGLLEAYSLLPKDSKKIKIVIAGRKGWLYKDIFKKVLDLGLKENVIFTDYIQEEDKPFLIKGARAFVLPSFWEGFGMDVVSAMACGVPVVCSKVASLPEVAGKAAIYVNPWDIDDIKRGLEKVLNLTRKEYNTMIREGLRQVQKFSWDKCAKKTLKILKEAA